MVCSLGECFQQRAKFIMERGGGRGGGNSVKFNSMGGMINIASV